MRKRAVHQASVSRVLLDVVVSVRGRVEFDNKSISITILLNWQLSLLAFSVSLYFVSEI
jgi:hypothetical protein